MKKWIYKTLITSSQDKKVAIHEKNQIKSCSCTLTSSSHKWDLEAIQSIRAVIQCLDKASIYMIHNNILQSISAVLRCYEYDGVGRTPGKAMQDESVPFIHVSTDDKCQFRLEDVEPIGQYVTPLVLTLKPFLMTKLLTLAPRRFQYLHGQETAGDWIYWSRNTTRHVTDLLQK